MATILIGAVVFAVIGLAAYSVFRDHKRGGSCSCGCAECQHGKNSCGH